MPIRHAAAAAGASGRLNRPFKGGAIGGGCSAVPRSSLPVRIPVRRKLFLAKDAKEEGKAAKTWPFLVIARSENLRCQSRRPDGSAGLGAPKGFAPSFLPSRPSREID